MCCSLCCTADSLLSCACVKCKLNITSSRTQKAPDCLTDSIWGKSVMFSDSKLEQPTRPDESSVPQQILILSHSASYAVCLTQLVDLDVQQRVFMTLLLRIVTYSHRLAEDCPFSVWKGLTLLNSQVNQALMPARGFSRQAESDHVVAQVLRALGS